MSREHLFRAKRVDNREWETGSIVVIRGGCLDESVYIADKMTGYLTPVIPETVGQFTGLCDKNGNKIFEEDILKWIDSQSKGRCIQGAVSMFGFSWYVKNIFNGDYENWSWSNNTHEIIGNIHDNPELLEVEE